MPRVTPAEVKEIVTTSIADPIVETWIGASSKIVDKQASVINGDSAVLTQIELYLAAHFIAMLDPEVSGQIKRTKIDIFETEFNSTGLSEELLNRTPYGVTANMLAGGCLLPLTKAKASVDFL